MYSLTTVWTILGLVYALSVVVMVLVSLNAMRNWHTAYWCNRELSAWANWHPVILLQDFGNAAVPSRSVEHNDRVAFLVISLLPWVNTTAPVVMFVGYAVECLRQVVSRHNNRKNRSLA